MHNVVIPQYESSVGHRLWVADGHEVTASLPDHSVDVILTDPPYNLAGYSTGNIKASWRKELNNDIAAWDGTPFDPATVLDGWRRVLKPTGSIFAFTSYNLLGRWHQVFDPVFDTFQMMVWHKTNPPPKLRRAGFLNSCELVICCWNKGHKWHFGNQRDMHNFMEYPICMGKERVKEPHHPTQKPVRVLEHILRLCTDPGDVVYDPYMGVGSTGAAARTLGLEFWGVDLLAEYVASAATRLGAEQSEELVK